jgi:anti-sigma28 factor (negative regulator of flagellin synthesis)
MKIQPLGHSDAISKYTSGSGAVPAKGSPSAEVSDSVVLSEGAQKYSSLLKQVRQAVERSCDNEACRAADIAERIKEGTYQVSADDVVSGILGKHFPKD